MRFLIKAKCPQSICILALIWGEDIIKINLIHSITYDLCSTREHWICGCPRDWKRFKTNQKYFKFMGYKMRLRWNTEASYFRCWMKNFSVCVCIFVYARMNSLLAHVFEAWFCVQTSILRFFNEPIKIIIKQT